LGLRIDDSLPWLRRADSTEDANDAFDRPPDRGARGRRSRADGRGGIAALDVNAAASGARDVACALRRFEPRAPEFFGWLLTDNGAIGYLRCGGVAGRLFFAHDGARRGHPIDDARLRDVRIVARVGDRLNDDWIRRAFAGRGGLLDGRCDGIVRWRRLIDGRIGGA
jgi:hypothetical protein